MTKEDFIKKYGNDNSEFIADLNSFATSYVSEDNYDDEDDYEQDEEDRREAEYEDQCERAASCKCGAYQISKNGNPIHVADCICGAD